MAYFRADKNGYDGKGYCAEEFGVDGYGAGDVVPYMKNGRWYNPKTFQLILPGDDGQFGPCDSADGASHDHGDDDDLAPRDLSNPDTVTNYDWDNITNFSEGATLDSERE